MAELWCPWATRQQEPYNGSYTGGPAKGLLHSTEVPFGGGWATYRDGTKPHLEAVGDTATQTVRVRQFYPLDQPSRALQDGPLAVRTNRDGVVQVECGFRAERVGDVPAWFWAGLARLLRWVEANHGVNPGRWATFKAYPASYGLDNGVRFTAAAWDGFDGWCGHMHVPDGNSHGDPGLVPVALLRQETDMDWADIDAHSAWFVDKARVAVQAELGDENVGAFSDRIVAKVLAALPAVPPPAAIDYDLLADKVADKLAARLAQ